MKVIELFSKRIFARAYQIVRNEGFSALFRRVRDYRAFGTYGRWIARYDTLDRTTRQYIDADIARLPSKPTISIIMTISRDDEKWLGGTIRSVQTQLYPCWELLIAVGHPVTESLFKYVHTLVAQDSRVRPVCVEGPASGAQNVNAALKLASGEFAVLIDGGDALSETALYWVAKELIAFPDANLIFSDEDKIERAAHRSSPWFKPDWNPALMLSCNAVGRMAVYRRKVLERVGGFRAGFEGAEEYELILRYARASDFHLIRHIARVLYHRRGVAKDQKTRIENMESGRRALAEHLAIQNLSAEVHIDCVGYEIVYALPSPHPRVSIVMATTARPDIVGPSLKSLLERTSYDNWEIILLVNEQVRQSPERDAFLNQFSRKPNVRVVNYSDRPFNYSWVNNLGAAQATGDILCFLNDDTEIITIDWLDQLVARVSLPQVAAASPMLYYPDGTIQHAGVILGLGGVAGHACYRERRGSRGYFGRACLEQDVSCVTAACMAIRAEIFRAIGGFDETMPLAYNDVDLCLRLRDAGWRIIWTPAAELVHHESASFGRHDMGTNAEQYARDVALMRQRWRPILNADPFYNPNLSLEHGYRLAFPPRVSVWNNLS
jgi:GT2 family glycosyltransferase